MSKLLIKTTYKALLKTAKRLDSIVPAGVPRATALSELQAPSSTSFFEATRLAFRPAAASASAGSINAAFAAMRKVRVGFPLRCLTPLPSLLCAHLCRQTSSPWHWRHLLHPLRALRLVLARSFATVSTATGESAGNEGCHVRFTNPKPLRCLSAAPSSSHVTRPVAHRRTGCQ